MFKERILNSVTFGGDKTGKWRNTSTGGLQVLPTKEMVCDLYNDPANSVVVAPITSAVSGYESIRSTTRPKPEVNECRHIRTNSVVTLPFSLYYPRTNVVGYTTRDGIKLYNSLKYPRYILLPASYTYADKPYIGLDVSSAARRGYWNLQPRFESESQMLNFLFELKDFRDVTKNLFGIIDKVRAFKGFGKITRAPKSCITSKATGTLAEGVLFMNFAVQPLIKDITALIVTAQTLAKEAEAKFTDTGTRPHTVHYSEYLKNEFVALSSQQYEQWFDGKQSQVLFTASMERTYSVRPRSAYETFCRYWGLDFTFEALWNALPFSFLPDYLLGIGNAIHAMETDPNVDPCILTYYESILSKSTRGRYIRTNYPNGLITTDGIHCNKTDQVYTFVGGCENSYYDRYFAYPNYGPALPMFKKIKERQLVNVIALLRVMF